MEVAYKRELDHNYLVLWQEEGQENYQLDMVTGNRIPGLLSCKASLLDQKIGLYYEITSRQSLRLMLERKRLTAEELQSLLRGLQKAAEICREYLLDTAKILLNPDYIYLEPDTWELDFCYFPFEEQELQEELLRLAEYLLERLDRQDQHAVSLGYEFYRMAGEANDTLERLLEQWEKNDVPLQAMKNQPAKNQLMEKESVEQESFLETVFLKKERGEELVLRSKAAVFPTFRILGESFLVGKKKDAVDGFLKARGISRFHARITREDGEYYLTDLNSTNGTFLNGGRLGVNEKARIRQGDCIEFADVEYVVGE